MSNIARMMQRATAGAGGAGLDVDEVFSTFLYDGTGSAQTITNNIDLSGEGGLVWIKTRTNDVYTGYDGLFFDTERTLGKKLIANSTNAEASLSNGFTAFNSNGFSIGSSVELNSNGEDIASWTFRKAPKFFDVVTYTGNGSARTISHNLGATVGSIFIKRLDAADSWITYHRGIGATKFMYLDRTDAAAETNVYFNDTEPTDSVFTVGTNRRVNQSGSTYVAYLFAHNNNGDGGFGPDADQDVIKCGSYTGNGSETNGTEVDLGFEPQWLLVKVASTTGDWFLVDNMRGWGPPNTGQSSTLKPNASSAESSNAYNTVELTPTGFKLHNTTDDWNGSSKTYIYMAIRRGPLAAPDDATKVFFVDSGTAANNVLSTGFNPDMSIVGRTTGGSKYVGARLTGSSKYLFTDSTAAEASYPGWTWDESNQFKQGMYNANNVSWTWKRAPSYFDVCCYTGTGSNRTVSHNLDVEPEIVIVKQRSSGNEFFWYVKSLGNTKKLELPGTAAAADAAVGGNQLWNSTTPTSSVFSVSDNPRVNDSGETYIAYLFATVAGVSKVGSYTGNGSTQNIDCGFSNSARFVLIKETSGTGDWYVLDSERGITTSVAPSLYLNNTNAEDAFNIIDPLSSGFIAKGGLNGSGNSYIFYAIA